MPKTKTFTLIHSLVITLLVMAVGTVSSVMAQPSPGSDHADVSLVSEHTILTPGSSSTAGLYMDLEDGWHTYWLNPGDSGIPATIAWEAPEGIEFEAIKWPYPSVFKEEHLITHGFKDETLLFIPYTVSDDIQPGTYEVKAELEYLVCLDVCLPAFESHSFTIEISSSETHINNSWSDVFARFRDKLPQESDGLEAAFTIDDGKIILRLNGDALPDEHSFSGITFFPHQDDVVEPSAKQEAVFSDGSLWLQLPQSRYSRTPPQSLDGVLVIETEDGVNAVSLSISR